ncbi:hypothetical protein DEJ51_14440 [Streptomyces venezuelae]|uniref:Uncharacterized protein n=1 Tax=Streptomyces venezuelae TaxID=54571 RepID=A0A5P2DM58_STRVZ|nr:hypothetical protein DEJ51_14440 [Streptomyces venezuelae]
MYRTASGSLIVFYSSSTINLKTNDHTRPRERLLSVLVDAARYLGALPLLEGQRGKRPRIAVTRGPAASLG